VKIPEEYLLAYEHGRFYSAMETAIKYIEAKMPDEAKQTLKHELKLSKSKYLARVKQIEETFE